MGALLSKHSTLKQMYHYICQGWFGYTFVMVVLPCFLLTRMITTAAFWLTTTQKEKLCRQLAGVCFRVLMILNPQIELVSDSPNGHNHLWDEMCKSLHIPGSRAPVVMLNHTSMLDGLVYSASMPVRHIQGAVTMAKAGLFKLPLFGQILSDCGHKPVYFNSNKLGNFKVDKEAQNKVMVSLEEHIQNGGCLAFYPEGQLNRGDTNKLQSFRRGSFAMMKKHKLEAWGFLHAGVEDCWPLSHSIGGLPSTIRISVFRIPDPENFDEMDVTELSEYMQLKMQEHYDGVVSRHKEHITKHLKSE